MKLLAIETATEACSAALYLDGEVREEYEFAPRGHAELVLGMVDRLLTKAQIRPVQLDAVAFGRGPGAFTGVRIATGVIQGIAYAADLPVVPVSTLAALAQGGLREFGWTHIAAAIDARMNEVYWAAFSANDAGLMVAHSDEVVCAPDQVPLLDGKEWHGIGSGWQTFSEALSVRQEGKVLDWQGEYLPHAQDVAVLAVDAFAKGQVVTAREALPVYLRDKVVQSP